MKQPWLKWLCSAEVNNSWFQSDSYPLAADFGAQYVNAVLTGIQYSIDRGGLQSISKCLEKDMQ